MERDVSQSARGRHGHPALAKMQGLDAKLPEARPQLPDSKVVEGEVVEEGLPWE